RSSTPIPRSARASPSSRCRRASRRASSRSAATGSPPSSRPPRCSSPRRAPRTSPASACRSTAACSRACGDRPLIIQERLRPETFRLPVEKIRAGYKSDIYFARTKLILERDQRHDRVTMQVFQKHPNAVIVGTDHSLAILQVGAGRYRDRARSDALFERYLDAERRAYVHWAALPGSGDWDAYAPLAREVFEISHELATLWEPGW